METIWILQIAAIYNLQENSILKTAKKVDFKQNIQGIEMTNLLL